jgi:hypothetical protein
VESGAALQVTAHMTGWRMVAAATSRCREGSRMDASKPFISGSFGWLGAIAFFKRLDRLLPSVRRRRGVRIASRSSSFR